LGDPGGCRLEGAEDAVRYASPAEAGGDFDPILDNLTDDDDAFGGRR
jgi:hypothetical protein